MTDNSIPGVGRISYMDGVTRRLHAAGLTWTGGGQWSDHTGGIGNHCVYVRVREGMEVSGITVGLTEDGWSVTPQWRRELPDYKREIVGIDGVAAAAVRVADAVEWAGLRPVEKHVPEEG